MSVAISHQYRAGGERSFVALTTKSHTQDGDFAESTLKPPFSVPFNSGFGEGRPFMDLVIEAQSAINAVTTNAAIEVYGRTTAMGLVAEPVPSDTYRDGLLGTILLTRDEWDGHLIGKRQTHILRGLRAPHDCTMQFYLRPVGCNIYRNARITVVTYSGGGK